MKKLSKSALTERDEFVAQLSEKREEAEAALSAASDAVSEYNKLIGEVEEWRDRIVGEMDDYISERSEKWAESEAASNYESWKSAFEDLDFSKIDEVATDVDSSLEEELEALPEQPDS